MEIISKHRPFKATGDDFANSNPMFAYYFYKYYISVIKPIFEDSKDAGERAEVEQEIKDTFKVMNKIAPEAGLNPSDEVNIKAMLEYTELMFAKNDHYHQQGKFSKQIAEDYLTIYRLYEVIGKFSKLDEGQSKRRVYSKKKFIDIMKELKKNPALEYANPAEVKKSVAPGSQLPPPPAVFKEEKKIEKIEEEIKKSNFKPLPRASKLISFDKIQMQIEANRSMENAISELSFDRFKYARDELMHALELLDQIIEN
jgi:hypothetical protein